MAEIAMAATLGPKLFVSAEFDFIIKQMWEQSLATAVWAREIARQGRRNVESTFLCGLLFQIGKPVVLQEVSNASKLLGLEITEANITAVIERHQSAVSQVLAKEWHLPEAILDTIAGVENPHSVTGSADIINTVLAAQVFAKITAGYNDIDLKTLIANPHIVAINAYAEDVEKLLEKQEAVAETVASLSL